MTIEKQWQEHRPRRVKKYEDGTVHRKIIYNKRHHKRRLTRDRLFSLVLNFIPPSMVQKIIVCKLKQLDSYEERETAYDLMTQWYCGRKDYFSESYDYAIQNLDKLVTSDRDGYSQLTAAKKRTLEALSSIGIATAEDGRQAINKWHKLGDNIPEDLLAVLIGSNVITTVSQIDDINPAPFAYRSAFESQDELNITENLKTLQGYGVPTEDIRKSLSPDLYHTTPARLRQNLKAIEVAGINIENAYREICDIIFRTSSKTINFVTTELMADNITLLQAYKTLLRMDAAPYNKEAIKALRLIGVLTDEMPKYQNMIRADESYHYEKNKVADRILTLHSTPFCLFKENILECEEYIINRDDFQKFVGTLKAYGLTQYEHLILFKPLFNKITSNKMASILGTLQHIMDLRAQPKDAVDFIKTCVADQVDEYNLCYLQQQLSIDNTEGLRAVIAITKICSLILRYAVEKERLQTVRKLRKWYYEDAPGVTSATSLYDLGSAGELLLEDAFSRKSFMPIRHNNKTLGEAIGFRRDQHIDNLAIGNIRKMLDITNGIIIPRSLKYAINNEPEKLDASINELEFIIRNIKNGNGPTTEQLTENESAAIAMVFGISEEILNRSWSNVVNIVDTTLTPESNEHYRIPTQWERTEYKKIEAGQINDDGFVSITNAIIRADNDREQFTDRPNEAYRGFRIKHLQNPAATPHDTRPYLGLFAVAVPKLSRRLKDVAEAYSEINRSDQKRRTLLVECEQVFSVDLEDIVQESMYSIVQYLCGNKAIYDATLDAFRIPSGHSNESGKQRSLLEQKLQELLQKTKQVFLSWVRKEKGKYSKSKASDHNLICVHTKTPAAFFAKESARLCTSGRTSLWACNTHSHILVFDADSPFLIGMASIYIEKFKEIKQGNTLIIRNLSTAIEAKNEYDLRSVATSFLDMARKLAEKHNCIAAAFTEQSGQHYCTNNHELWQVIKRMYIRERLTPYHDHHVDRATDKRPARINVQFSPYKESATEMVNIFVFWHNTQYLNV